MSLIITALDSPMSVIADEVIAEFISYDGDLDASKDRIVPVLRRAAIEAGERITGAVWEQTRYTATGTFKKYFDGRTLCGMGRCGLVLPLSPVFGVEKVEAVLADGTREEIAGWALNKSAIDTGRPWAELIVGQADLDRAAALSITFLAGWTAEALPESLRAWALTRISTLYDYREDLVTGTITATMPRHHADGLLDRWRVYGNPYA